MTDNPKCEANICPCCEGCNNLLETHEAEHKKEIDKLVKINEEISIDMGKALLANESLRAELKKKVMDKTKRFPGHCLDLRTQRQQDDWDKWWKELEAIFDE